MSPEEKAKLVRECERLRKLAYELDMQVNSLDQVLAALSVKLSVGAQMQPVIGA